MKDSAANTKNESASMIRYIELSHPEFEYEAISYYRLRPAANSSGACQWLLQRRPDGTGRPHSTLTDQLCVLQAVGVLKNGDSSDGSNSP